MLSFPFRNHTRWCRSRWLLPALVCLFPVAAGGQAGPLEKKLTEAVETRDLFYARDILLSGANPQEARSGREGLLAEAFDQGDDGMIVLLARNGLTVDPATGDSAVNLILRLGSAPALEELLAMGAEPDLSPLSRRRPEGCAQAVFDAFRTGDPEILALADGNGIPVFDPGHWGEQDFVLLSVIWGHAAVQDLLHERGLQPVGGEWRSKAPLTWHFDETHNHDWNSHPFAAQGHTEPTDSHRRMWERLAEEEEIADRLRNRMFRLNVWRRIDSGKIPSLVRIPDDADTLRIWIGLGFDPATIPDYFPGQAVCAGGGEMIALLEEYGIDASFRAIDPGPVGFWENHSAGDSSQPAGDWDRVEELYRTGDFMGARILAESLWESGTHNPRGAMLRALATFRLLPTLVTARTAEAAEADKQQKFLDADPFDRSHRVYPDYTAAQLFADAGDTLQDLSRTMARTSGDPAGWSGDDASFYRQNLPFLLEQVAYPLAAIVALDRERALRPRMDAYRDQLDELWEETAAFFRRDGGRIPNRAWDARAANGTLRARSEDDFLTNVLLHYFEGDLGASPEVTAALRPRLLVAVTSAMRGKPLLPSLGPDRLRYPGAWRDLQAHVRTLANDPWARLVDSYINTAIWQRDAQDRGVSLEARVAVLAWSADVLRNHPPGPQDMIYGAAHSLGPWLESLPIPPLEPLQSDLQARGLGIPREFLGEDVRDAVRWLYLTIGQPGDRDYLTAASEMARLIQSRGGWQAFREALFNRLNDPWYPNTKDKMEAWIEASDEKVGEFDETLAAMRTTAVAPSVPEIPLVGKLLYDPRKPSTWNGPDPGAVRGAPAIVPMGDWCVLQCRYPNGRFELIDHFHRHDFETGTTALIATMPEEMEGEGTFEAAASDTHLFLWGRKNGLRVLDLVSGEWAHPLRTADNPPAGISACANGDGTIFVFARTGGSEERLEILRYDPGSGRLSSLSRFDRGILGKSLSNQTGFSLHIVDDRYLFPTKNRIVPDSVFDLAAGAWIPNQGASAELAGAVPGLGASPPVTPSHLAYDPVRRGLDSWNPESKWDFKVERADSSAPFLAKISFRNRHSREDPVEVNFRLIDASDGDLPEPPEGESYRILGFDLLPTGVFIRLSPPFLGVWISGDEIARLFRLSGLAS